ncbi:Zn finger domain-containing DnaJ-class molecular chaperone [Desulfocapsa sulfexigens DSM 10523]|uniref:Zn finger domain-containing DnaJ-class molecular chaperone n=1 Tax=Desulfocapsa sulfexigens (strain DSM 10523 / SB164P1) TaxID=1167006 RepID=M1PA37_DESSD|nr:J domain-containing protein [Desulfocapsa sulfexigens]AGF78482.1 Zn finger domain-containing DnaJ-class molecular chaperone [Desulfocapsa sulfexigens DSM 10523]
MATKSLQKPGEPEPTLYLSRSVLSSPTRYSLRLAYWNAEENCFRTTELIDLGYAPENFLHYPNNTCFHLDTDLVHHIEKLCGRDMEPELEQLLWPFVDPTVQRKMEHFFSRANRSTRFKPGIQLLSFDGRPAHSFDKRRLHFLRFGSTDQGSTLQMPARLEAKLLNRSRDELEQYFLEEEARLREHELKSYLYTALNLQKHFTEAYARSIPQALEPEKIDEAFMEEFCLLNKNKDFWQERTNYDALPDYLIRYLILFFDSSFPHRNRRFAQAREFMDGHRGFRWPERKNTIRKDDISAIFEESEESLRKADKKEITRLYRTKAKALHPDTGGDQEKFIRLTEAYELLLRDK